MADAERLNSIKDKEIAELKIALEASEDKWYNVSFADVKNSIKPVMFQSRRYEFGEGWMAALVALGVSKDSPLKNHDQVPYPKPPPPVQDPTNAKDEETESMRELVQEIDSHAELIDLEITSDPNTMQSAIQQLPNPTTQSPMNVDPVLLD